MMKEQWEKISAKLNAMTVRERVMIFATIVTVLLTLLDMLLLEPLFVRQKALHSQLSQQQQMINEVQTRIGVLVQENSPDANSPQRNQLKRIRQELAEGNAFLKSNRERLVQPEKMAEHLRQLLNRNNRLQLVTLQTLPVTPLIEQPQVKGGEQVKAEAKVMLATMQEKQVYKHGVTFTLRGNYLDLLQYLGALESLPQQMYWARAQLNVVQYPTAELTLILYTLSLDKTWLQI